MERAQKHLITGFLGVKINAPYEILLAETSLFPIELDIVRMLILYRQRVAEINSKGIPVKINHEALTRRKGIVEESCPTDKELIMLLQECYRKGKWRRHIKRKQHHYIESRQLQNKRRNQGPRLPET